MRRDKSVIIMKKAFKIVKIVAISLVAMLVLLVSGLAIYTSDSYQPLQAMKDEISSIELNDIQVTNDIDQLSYQVATPKKNIIIIPGGKVNPLSYQYLAIQFALADYDVTIVKTLFNLAILTPKYGALFIQDGIDNVVIGHSLGGTVGSIFSHGDERVTDMIFLASYPISDVSDKHVLLMTAENDLVLDRKSLEKSLDLLPLSYVTYDISGGNHGQFGWYGPQKGDGIASISTKAQQDIVIEQSLFFLA